MAGDLGVGFVDILPRTDKFVSALSGDVNKGLEQVGSQASGSSKLVSGLQTAFIGLGVAAVAGVAKAVQSTVDWAREVAGLQKVTGQSAESSSALLAVMGEFGITATQASTAFGIFDKNLINGTTSLSKYGIATEDAQGNLLPFDDLLANTADKFVTLGSAQEKTAFATNVFGKAGKSLIPILKQGSAGLEELKQKAAETGLVIGQDTVDAAVELGHQQRILGESFKGLSVTIGTQFLPIATDLVKWATEFVQLLVKIPGPVFEVVAGFLALTGAVAGVTKVAGGVASTWTKVIDVFGGADQATAELADTTGELADATQVASGATKGWGAAVASIGIAGAAAIVAGIAAIGAEIFILTRDANAAHRAFEEGINQDLLALSTGGKAARGVRDLATATKITSQEMQDAFGMTRAEVLDYNRSIDQSTEALGTWEHQQEINNGTAKQTQETLRGLFKEISAGTTAIAEIDDATTLLNKTLSSAGRDLQNFAKRSGADVEGILGGIAKVVNDSKSTVDQVVAAYQDGIAALRKANQEWHDSIVAAFGGAGAALDKFADKSNVSISKAIGSLESYTRKIHAFGTDVETIQKRFGDRADDFIEWASTQGLAQSGLVSAVASSNKKMGDSFIENFKRADQATGDLATQIQRALDPVFDHIIFELKNVVRAIQGLPPLKFKADTSEIDQAIAHVKGGLASLPTEKVVTIITRRESSGHGGATGGVVTPWGIVPGFAAGGTTDTIPAMLSPGEFVLRKSAVDRIGLPALQGMNQGGAVSTISKPQKLDGSMRIYDWRNGLASLDGELVWEDAVRTR